MMILLKEALICACPSGSTFTTLFLTFLAADPFAMIVENMDV
jgi:hypothetical protein